MADSSAFLCLKQDNLLMYIPPAALTSFIIDFLPLQRKNNSSLDHMDSRHNITQNGIDIRKASTP